MLTEREKMVIAAIQGDIPVTERPFLEIARQIGMSEDELIDTLNSLRKRKIIRRFGATIRHQKSGFEANAMVAWQVDEADVEEAARKMASSRKVSHCYQRVPGKDWPYNLYTMIHAKDEQSCHDIARRLAERASADTYTLLFSERELKKTSMQYFPNETDG